MSVEPEIDTFDIKTHSCLQKGIPNKTVCISVKNPNFSKTKTPRLGSYNIEDFTAGVLAIKFFFMDEIYELKQEIQSLKQKVCVDEYFSGF